MQKQPRSFHKIQDSFWFIPSLIVVIMIILAHFVIYLDHVLAPSIERLGFEKIILQQEAMRTFLATIAGSMMTVAGVVFSITILVLSQAAGHYTSRVLRNFIRNRNNQFVLGLFVGIFIFCLFLLANLHPSNNLVAAISAFILALLGVASLISFIHFMSTSIQSSEIILNIKNETIEILNKIYPNALQEDTPEPVERITGMPILATETGYIQRIDRQWLLQMAMERGKILQLNKKTGEFIIEGEVLSEMEGEGEADSELTSQLNKAFTTGAYRTAVHDITFGIQQLVDIALKGLAPGVNDLMTAQLAIGYLSSIYCKLAGRRIVYEIVYDKEQCLRLIFNSWSFASLIEMGFIPIIENAQKQPTVVRKIETDLQKIQNACKEKTRKETVNRLIQLIHSK